MLDNANTILVPKITKNVIFCLQRRKKRELIASIPIVWVIHPAQQLTFPFIRILTQSYDFSCENELAE